MPRYFFDITDAVTRVDEEGEELEGVKAARIAAVLSKAIAAKPEFKRLQAYHIDYVTNSGDHDDAHFVDGIDFRKNPEGKFLHHKS